jgi:hypothetical protein
MKLLLVALCCTIAFSSFSQGKVKVKDDKVKIKGTAVTTTSSLYTPGYSANFRLGDAKYSNVVLQLWKDYDNNTLSAHDYLSDTVTMYLPDGSVLKGKQQVFDVMGKYRAGIKTSSSTVDAWVPLHSNDRNTDLVGIWGTETDTMLDGTVTKSDIHEIWAFNKAGKVAWMKQWTAKSSPM